MHVAANDDWVPVGKAAQQFGISQSKLSRMVKLGKVEWKRNPRDERQRLVNVNQLNRLFYPREE